MSAAAEPVVPAEPANRAPVRAWSLLTTALMWAVFFQAITAGRILAGDGWARDVHRNAANVLLLATLGAGVVAVVRLRDRAYGRRFGVILIAIGVGVFVQHGLGTAAADGEDTLWLHVPLGMALLGLLAHLRQLADRVGGPA